VSYEFLPGLGLNPGSTSSLANGSKFLMIPGFMAGDPSLYALATGLRGIGHRVWFAGIWVNIDCPRETMRRVSRALETAFDSDGRKVVVLGHSLGGIYARELAHRYPEMIERTILLGSAIREPLDHSNAFVRMWFMTTRRSHRDDGTCLDHIESLCGAHRPWLAPEVAETIVYSRNDMVVDWRSCIEFGPNIEAIEVSAGHNGMPFSPEVFAIVAERARHPHATYRSARRRATRETQPSI